MRKILKKHPMQRSLRTLRALLAAVSVLAMLAATGTPAAMAADSGEVQQHEEAPIRTIEMIEDDIAAVSAQTTAAASVDAKSTDSEAVIMVKTVEAVRQALLDRKEYLDLTALNLQKDGYFTRIWAYCPYTKDNEISLSVGYSGSTLTKLYIVNSLDAAETQRWINQVDRAIAELYAKISDSSLSVLDQAMILHDTLDADYHYDTDYKCYLTSCLLTDGKGVCQAYAYLFQYIMNLKGNECYSTVSSTHAWNIIRINGKYYHIDATWDDPTNDRYGQAEHQYFLKSDSAIRDSTEHNTWDLSGKYPCSDTSLDDAWWVEADSPIALEGQNRYYCAYNSSSRQCELRCYNTDTQKITVVTTLGTWSAGGSMSYCSACSGLFSYGGLIYYNTAGQIRTYDPVTCSSTSVASAAANSYVYGITRSDSTLTYTTSSPQVTYQKKDFATVSLPVLTTGNTWMKFRNHWYLLSPAGKVQIGWQKDSGKWYYLNSSGDMATGWKYVEGTWYYLNRNGDMKTGWLKSGGKWYYLSSDGSMKIGWQYYSGRWYYLNQDGDMATGWKQIQGTWYYFNADGSMKTGWQYYSGSWYWLNSEGAMVTNTSVTYQGQTYYFNASGVCTNP